jgi:hypothetical protein
MPAPDRSFAPWDDRQLCGSWLTKAGSLHDQFQAQEPIAPLLSLSQPLIAPLFSFVRPELALTNSTLKSWTSHLQQSSQI